MARRQRKSKTASKKRVATAAKSRRPPHYTEYPCPACSSAALFKEEGGRPTFGHTSPPCEAFLLFSTTSPDGDRPPNVPASPPPTTAPPPTAPAPAPEPVGFPPASAQALYGVAETIGKAIGTAMTDPDVRGIVPYAGLGLLAGTLAGWIVVSSERTQRKQAGTTSGSLFSVPRPGSWTPPSATRVVPAAAAPMPASWTRYILGFPFDAERHAFPLWEESPTGGRLVVGYVRVPQPHEEVPPYVEPYHAPPTPDTSWSSAPTGGPKKTNAAPPPQQ
jgi:hypothetical protein